MTGPARLRASGCSVARSVRLLPSACLLLSLSCAGSRPPAFTPAGAGPAPLGYRALFRCDSEGPSGKDRFKVAVALLPPDRLRLEFYGPIGGPRLVVASDGASLLALWPLERSYDRSDAVPAAMDRLIGLPLDGRQVVALLMGRPMCDPETTEHQVMTRPAATFGRTLSWYEVTCPPDSVRYQARCADRGGTLEGATIREGISGAMILEVEYGDHEEGLGPRWPRRIRLRMQRTGATVSLVALEGPEASDVPETIFAPPVPEGFEKRPLLATLAAPGLLGSTADGER